MPLDAVFVTEACRDRWHPAICQWCLNQFDPEAQRKSSEQLGALKTRLMIPDAVTPIICSTCYQMALDYSEQQGPPGRLPNFLLRVLGPGT
jgi:hypothetical protein